MRVAFTEKGRVMNLSRYADSEYPPETYNFIHALAKYADEVVLFGRSRNFEDSDFPTNVIDRTSREVDFTVLDDVDHVVVLTLNAFSASLPIPKVRGHGTMKPLIMGQILMGPVLQMINDWVDKDPHRDVVWIANDARTRLIARDVKWPLKYPVLAQYDHTRDDHLHYRFSDTTPGPWSDEHPGYWVAPRDHRYAGMELVSATGTYIEDRDDSFIIVANENSKTARPHRKEIVKEWVQNTGITYKLYGKWSDDAQSFLGHEVNPVPYSQYHSIISRAGFTFSMPASGKGWVTTKVWEAFASGVICFLHPRYDDQEHVVPRSPRNEREELLSTWLRVDSPDELLKNYERLRKNPSLTKEIRHAQREHFDDAKNRLGVNELYRELDRRSN